MLAGAVRLSARRPWHASFAGAGLVLPSTPERSNALQARRASHMHTATVAVTVYLLTLCDLRSLLLKLRCQVIACRRHFRKLRGCALQLSRRSRALRTVHKKSSGTRTLAAMRMPNRLSTPPSALSSRGDGHMDAKQILMQHTQL